MVVASLAEFVGTVSLGEYLSVQNRGQEEAKESRDYFFPEACSHITKVHIRVWLSQFPDERTSHQKKTGSQLVVMAPIVIFIDEQCAYFLRRRIRSKIHQGQEVRMMMVREQWSPHQ